MKEIVKMHVDKERAAEEERSEDGDSSSDEITKDYKVDDEDDSDVDMGEDDGSEVDDGLDDEEPDFEDSDEDEDEKEAEAKQKKNKNKQEGFQAVSQAVMCKNLSQDVLQRRTVYVRNLPFTAKEEQIRECFAQFGEVKRVSMVKTKLAGDVEAFKGVAFVEFDKSEAAMSAVQRADVSTDDLPVRLRRMVQKGKTISETAKQLALEGVGGLWVEGRLLYVQLALPREDAKKMETEHAEQKKKQDKRNLWLAEEGLIVAGTPAAEGMSSKDIERRTKLWREAKTKLAFPNYCISKTRLSVHNMPANLNEEGLRDLFKEASDNAPIKQVKVVREEAKEGQKIGRSKRFGFVEFQDHEDALNALRKVNNNPQVWTNQARPIVAFAVDDVRMLHIQELKRKAMHERAKRTGEPQEDQVSSSNNDRGRGRGRGRGGTGAGRGRGRGRGRGGGFGASGRSSSRGGRSSEGGGRMSGVKRKSGQSSESSQRSRSNSTRPSKQRRTK
eukprot:TRINITY_DN53222_c0_g1_i4.p1 TRINITY_DN53222_c0_g1~~TRINITY_DN53222_c0_g1_i4.p1  ORF type:complete len:576 (-),score=186.19 TRINITY_DN53222_c0_g1_i4:42-1541(-)